MAELRVLTNEELEVKAKDWLRLYGDDAGPVHAYMYGYREGVDAALKLMLEATKQVFKDV